MYGWCMLARRWSGARRARPWSRGSRPCCVLLLYCLMFLGFVCPTCERIGDSDLWRSLAGRRAVIFVMLCVSSVAVVVVIVCSFICCMCV